MSKVYWMEFGAMGMVVVEVVGLLAKAKRLQSSHVQMHAADFGRSVSSRGFQADSQVLHLTSPSKSGAEGGSVQSCEGLSRRVSLKSSLLLVLILPTSSYVLE